jgi:mycothiol synthase
VITITAVGSGAELERWLELRNALIPDWTLSLDGVERARASNPRRVDLLAWMGGEPVAGAIVTPRSEGGEHHSTYVSLWVVPARRRSGIGAELAAYVLGSAGGVLETMVRETNTAGLRFAERYGFEEHARNQAAVLDVSSAPVPSPSRVEVVTLAARPDLARSLYEVVQESSADVPGGAPFDLPFDAWLARFGSVSEYAETCFLAVEDGRVVGFGELELAGDGTAEHLMTGVRRSAGGRGIAGALKEAQIAWAQEHGLRELRTENELRNEPIRRLNARLGYRPEAAWIVLRVTRGLHSTNQLGP